MEENWYIFYKKGWVNSCYGFELRSLQKNLTNLDISKFRFTFNLIIN